MGVKHGLLQVKFEVKFILLLICLRYILKIWWPNIICNKDLWEATGQDDIHFEIGIKTFTWIGAHSKGREGLTVEPSRKQEERKTKEQLEKICYQRSR
jgi:hypothetical protein